MRDNLRNRLRPLGITDLLDETVELYKTNFALFIGMAAVLYVPIFIFYGLTASTYGQGGHSYNWGFVLLMAGEAAVTGALAFGISERYLDRKTSIADCYRRVLRPKVFARFLVAITLKYAISFGLYQLTAVLGLEAISQGTTRLPDDRLAAQLVVLGLLSIVWFIWMVYSSLRLVLVEPVFIIESRGALGSIGRSWRLMRGSILKGFWLYFIVILVVGLVVGTLWGPVFALNVANTVRGAPVSRAMQALSAILLAGVGTLMVPIPAVTSILLYYDTRIRKEGFDLQLLAAELDAKSRAFISEGASARPEESTPPSIREDR